MMGVLANSMPPSLVYVLMLVLLLMLLGGIAIGWFLGRMLGPRSGWRREIERDQAKQRRGPAPPGDAWSESAKRLNLPPHPQTRSLTDDDFELGFDDDEEENPPRPGDEDDDRR